MSMHLEGPWLSTTGKLKSKRRKYSSSTTAKRERELAAEWAKKLADWERLAPKFGAGRRLDGNVAVKGPVVANAPVIDPQRDTRQYRSLDTGGGIAARVESKVYTGTKIKGIGTMHKSNAVPIFSDEEAEDIARMRR